MAGQPVGVSSMLAVLAAVLRRPDLWIVAAVQVRRLAPRGWWRRPPFLPLPARNYLGFRLETMYGGDGPVADPADAIVWLEWCRSESRTR